MKSDSRHLIAPLAAGPSAQCDPRLRQVADIAPSGLDAPKERPILFSAPMVRAILAGTKTQTRRAVKGLALEWLQPENFTPEFVADRGNGVCPYGYPGDRLWVRETFYAYGRWVTQFNTKKGRDEWHFIDMTLECGHTYSYAADDSRPLPLRGMRDSGVVPGWWKRPAIFMRRHAARIDLENVAERVERLWAISRADVLAEGCDGYELTYAKLWESINGKGSWDANPWVWVIEFRRIQSHVSGGVTGDSLTSEAAKPLASSRPNPPKRIEPKLNAGRARS